MMIPCAMMILCAPKITNPVYGDGGFMPTWQILIEEVWGQRAEQHLSLAAGKSYSHGNLNTRDRHRRNQST